MCLLNSVLRSNGAVAVDEEARIEKLFVTWEKCCYRSLCVEELADKLAGKARIGIPVLMEEKQGIHLTFLPYLVGMARIERRAAMEEREHNHPRAGSGVFDLVNIRRSSCLEEVLVGH